MLSWTTFNKPLHITPFASGLVASGGDLKSGLIAVATAGMFNAVGTAFQSAAVQSMGSAAAHLAKSVAHGVVGGLSSVLQGGKFLSGFASGGVANFLGNGRLFEGLGNVGNGVARMVTGGIASVAGGGKFANGAVTASFAYVFNEGRHSDIESAPRHSHDRRGEVLFARATGGIFFGTWGFGLTADIFVSFSPVDFGFNLTLDKVNDPSIFAPDAKISSAKALITPLLGRFDGSGTEFVGRKVDTITIAAPSPTGTVTVQGFTIDGTSAGGAIGLLGAGGGFSSTGSDSLINATLRDTVRRTRRVIVDSACSLTGKC